MAEHDWLMMVYLVGSADGLWGELRSDLREIRRSRLTTDAVAVTVFLQSRDGTTGEYRRRVRGAADVVRHDRADGGDPATLAEFVAWSRRQVSARHVALCIGSHGTGCELAVNRAVGSSIDRSELAECLRHLTAPPERDLDVVALDSCLMGNLDVAFDVSSSTRVMVGSEAREPSAGWDYRSLLRDLQAEPDLTPEAFGTHVVAAYAEQYRGRASGTVTHAALRAPGVRRLRADVNVLADALLVLLDDDPGARQDLETARATSCRFDCGLVDLGSLCTRLARFRGSPRRAAVATAARAVRDRLTSGEVVLDRVPTDGPTTGLSVYLPTYYERPVDGFATRRGSAWWRMLQRFTLVPVP